MGVLRDSFQGFGCPKRHSDALLAKTMGEYYYSENIPVNRIYSDENKYNIYKYI